MALSEYDPSSVERAAQHYWQEHHSFTADEESSREKFYCLSMLPYPSGELHMGHVRNYTLGDVISRYQRFLGKNVMQPMGWDAFGLPAENAAIARHLPPAEWTHQNIERMKAQLQQLGYAIDWRRELKTCEPDYYHWEQWLFIQLYKKGLVYKKNSIVNWDPVDQTVLANEQVIDGKGWRSKALVEQREIPQWFFKITAYAEQLLEGLNTLPGWPESVITMQRNWIGRSKGLEIQFSLVDHPETVTVFTTRPDTLMGASYLAIAPRHPLALQMAEKNPAIAHFLEQCAQGKVAEADQAAQEKYGVASGLHAYHPLTQALLPIWITNFVLMEYGTGAIMAVPAHDARDHEFATHYHLPIQPVIQAPVEWDYKQAAHVEKGTLIHSGEFNGLRFEEAYSAIYALLREKGAAEERINYRLRDWGISRQRYWGTPIPMINCARCGSVPVPESNLPVILPTHLIPTGQGSPLKQDQSFIKTTCPECQGSAERETDTFDTFVESSWYYARYCSYNQAHAMLDKRTVYWTPVDQYIGGIEHAILHLLYARFFHKLLRDQGLVHSDEPFTRLLTQGMVLKDGSKMSKSRGNVVPPTPLIEKYGADTVRLFIIFAAPPEQALEWSDQGVEGAYRFLSRLWQWSSALPAPFRALAQSEHNPLHTLTASQQQFRRTVHVILHQANQDMERQQFNTVVSACMKLFNVISKYEEENETGRALLREAMGILLRLLAPIAPHITHTLWQSLGYGENILHTDWPRVDQHALQTDEKQMVIQINGKLRSTISVNANATHQAIEMAALKDEKIGKHLEGKQVTKIIVVPGKLVNIVIK